MVISLSERRQIENEMIFRQANEKVGDDLDKLDEHLIEEDFPELIRNGDIDIHFICECSDEDCKDRIPIKLSTYQNIHKNRKAFILKHNHQVKDIEKIIRKTKHYIIVEKNLSIPEPTGSLNPTDIDNSKV